MKKILTLGLILEGDNLLLGMKKIGFGQGRWNGFGGKVEPGETIEQAVAREFEEECLMKVLKSEKFGKIEFEFEGNPEILEVHFYRITKYLGQPSETNEMRPQWFKTSEIPYSSMWPDDRYWMPLFLQGKKFEGRIYFKDQNTILNADIREVRTL